MEKRILRRHLKNQKEKLNKFEQFQKENVAIYKELSTLVTGNEKALGLLKGRTRLFAEDSNK
jgi:5-formyltetrahydrofolate cyclo-ligase